MDATSNVGPSCANTTSRLVRSSFLHMIDNHELYRTSCEFELETRMFWRGCDRSSGYEPVTHVVIYRYEDCDLECELTQGTFGQSNVVARACEAGCALDAGNETCRRGFPGGSV